MSQRVTLEIKDYVAEVRLNRPDKLNAIDMDMVLSLIRVGEEVSAHEKVRAVVLAGEGRAFCAGLDFDLFRQMSKEKAFPDDPNSPSGGGQADSSSPNIYQRCAYIWQDVPVPVIAAIHGFAFGGGLQIALGADIRYMASDAKISIMEIKWGLVPDMSGTQTMRHLVRLDVIKELSFTGRTVEGPEAVNLGFATYLSDNPFEDAMKTAQVIARQSPDAIRSAKKLFNAAVLGTVEEGFQNEFATQASLIGQPNQIEAVMSNVEKRPPRFKP
jgi:enoyl-CoA hydratase/carnithine racemase